MVNATATFAFDKKSARSFDADGRMRVVGCTISTGEVNPYYGKEIPGRDRLGLDANTVYDLYRDPAELQMAVDSFNGLPLMIRHVAQTADDPRKHDQAGSVYNARLVGDRLLADLLVTDAKAIELIESGELADLSSSYRYTPLMTPGEISGRKYHGRMTGIQGNHVALVEDGRATGAHVADSALNSPTGAPNVDPNDTSNGNVDAANALQAILARLEAIDARLTAVEGAKTQTPQSEAETGLPASVNTADDADPDKDDDADKDDKTVAMDAKSVQAVVTAAVTAAVEDERKRLQSIEDAKRNCRGDLGDMIAMDSADDIYAAALKVRGVDVATVPAGAYQATYQAIVAATPAARKVVRANDSRTEKSFDTSRIRNLGH